MSGRRQAFLVKIWVDGDGESPATLTVGSRARGSVEHLESKRRLYFSEMAQLIEFLAQNGSGKRKPD
jgi:hypothetical protein